MSATKTFLLGILGGVFIGFGSFMAISIGGACPGLVATNPGLQKMVYGAFGLPFGLFLVLLCGAELFTGNTALLTAAVSATVHFESLALPLSITHKTENFRDQHFQSLSRLDTPI